MKTTASHGPHKPSAIHKLARFIGTRFNGVKGVDRFLRGIHHPDKRQKTWISSVESAYPAGPSYKLGSKIDFMKMDVEGAENLVLRGGREILKKARPYLIIENNSKSAVEVLEILRGIGYNIQSIAGSGGTDGYQHDFLAIGR